MKAKTETKKRHIIEKVSIAGKPGKRYDLTVEGGWITRVREAGPGEGTRWAAPGLLDMHLHMGWTDFDHGVQAKRSEEEVEERIGEGLWRLLSAGITGFRDAGGLSREQLCSARKKVPGAPEAFLCGGMLGGGDEKALSQAEEVLSGPAPWVKLFATGGIGAEGETVLRPTISEAVFYELVSRAHRAGKKVMVHTWGGETLDWSIRAGVDSVEHGIFMTRSQAEALAEKQIFYTATAAVYRLIAREDNPMQVPPGFRERAQRACESHAKAVGYALSAGVPFLFGTDFYADPGLIEHELEELFVLEDYGLKPEQAWESGTVQAARLLGQEKVLGRIAEGFRADLVLYDRDPYRVRSAEELKAAGKEVWKGGIVVKKEGA